MIWPDLTESLHEQVETNQLITIEKEKSETLVYNADKEALNTVFSNRATGTIKHVENSYSDFNRERLIYHMKSNLGPDLTISDIDNDGTEDIVISGSKGGFSSILFNMGRDKQVDLSDALSIDKEQSCVHVFDANQDGLQDIYIAGGGTDVSPFSPNLFDELWLNQDGQTFIKTDQFLPNNKDNISTSVVISNDIDNDGDLDLMIGERVKIGSYGSPCSGYLLKNDGKGDFLDVTDEWAPGLVNVGMINDAIFYDLNSDGVKELIVVGEFMEPIIYDWTGSKFEIVERSNLDGLAGWYNTIHISDINGDGMGDLILGNHGTNSRFQASSAQPIKLYYNDYDKNGFAEGIMTYSDMEGNDYPYALRHNIIEQLKYLKKRFPNYELYKQASINEIFAEEELSEADILSVENLQSVILVNQGEFKFEIIELPKEVQYTPIYAISSGDYDHDGDEDLVLGGNQYNALPEAGIYDASYGIYLENDGSGNFKYIPADKSGFKVVGQVRSIVSTDSSVIVALNNDAYVTYEY